MGLTPRKLCLGLQPSDQNLSNCPVMPKGHALHPVVWGSHEGFINVRECFFSYLRAEWQLHQCWKVKWNWARNQARVSAPKDIHTPFAFLCDFVMLWLPSSAQATDQSGLNKSGFVACTDFINRWIITLLANHNPWLDAGAPRSQSQVMQNGGAGLSYKIGP